MTTLYYVRHGRAENNLADCFYDDSDDPLIAEGRMQAFDAGRTLKRLGLDGMNKEQILSRVISGK